MASKLAKRRRTGEGKISRIMKRQATKQRRKLRDGKPLYKGWSW